MRKVSFVSVIIPCYNQGEFLEECLTSVFESSYTDLEVIVVNDGSTDNSNETIQQLQNQFKFTFINQNNAGPSNARNQAIKVATSTYILPLDADDKIGKDYISQAVQVLSSNPEIGIVYCNAEFFGELNGKWNLPDFDLQLMLARNLIFNCGLFRKVDFDKTQGYNDNMRDGWEDWDFWLSLLELNLKVHRLEEVGFYYRKRLKSRDQGIDNNKTKRLRNQILQNHKNLYLTNFFNPIEQYHQIQELKEFKKSFHQLKNSRDYRLGRLLLLPLKLYEYR